MGVGQCMVSECSVGSMSDQLAVSGGPLGGQWWVNAWPVEINECSVRSHQVVINIISCM